jgi:hypothetical protein
VSIPVNSFKVTKKNDTQVCLASVGIKLGFNTIWDAKGSYNVETPTYESKTCESRRSGFGTGGIIAILAILCCIICCVVIFLMLKKKGTAPAEQVDEPAPPAPQPTPQPAPAQVMAPQMAAPVVMMGQQQPMMMGQQPPMMMH